MFSGAGDVQTIGKLLKATEVAAILQISRTAAYRLLGREIPAVRFGGTIRVREVDLRNFIENNVTGGSNASGQ